MSENQEEVSVKAGPTGVELHGRGLQLNTWMTLITLLVVSIHAVGSYFMSRNLDSMAASLVREAEKQGASASSAVKETSAAIKEQTVLLREFSQSIREQNCLAQFEAKDRPGRSEFCKIFSR